MTKVLGTIGKVAGAVASVAALIPGGQVVAAIAGAVALVSNVGAQLTAPKPIARGSIIETVLAVEPPRPYMIGETYFGGVTRWQVGYGDTLKKVPNPYLWKVDVYSGVGPIESIDAKYFDFEPIGSYHTGFWQSDEQLGARPESTALVPPYGAATGWGSSSKLSGCAAVGWNLKFDRDGKRFSSGIPRTGIKGKGEKVYDPRLDDTFDGGSGSHRLGDETTYEYSNNPALHAGTYAYGRFQNGKRIFGVGVSDIDWSAIAAWANDCDANEWTASGVIFEGGEQSQQLRVKNLDDICAAGGGLWLPNGGGITFDWNRPRVPLATVTDDDILQCDFVGLKSYRERYNAVVPQWTSEAHNWQQISGAEIAVTAYATEDGERKAATWPLNLVDNETQAGELATYAVCDSREVGPVNVTLDIEWRFYKCGDTLTIESEAAGLDGDFVIIGREIDPVNLTVSFTLRGETASKHDIALGNAATAPAAPSSGQTAEERDGVASGALGRGSYRIRTYVPAYPVTGGDGTIDIEAFDGTIEDGRTISFPADSFTGLTVGTFYNVFWDLVAEEYVVEIAPATSLMESDQYVFVGAPATSDSGVFPTGITPPDGWSSDPNIQVP